MISLVIGNGESRRALDLNRYENKITLIGCNAVYRDLSVDHLICFDKRMVEESVHSDILNIYTRHRNFRDFKKIHKFKQVKLLPDLPYQGINKQDDPDHWNSGPYALLLASNLEHPNVFAVGFDLYGNQDLVNNIYKDTANYSNSKSKAVDPGFWIYQIKKIMRRYPNKKFYFFNNKDWSVPESWEACSNFKFVSIDKFYETIDTTLNTQYN
jgi:hypothetical protein